MYRRVAPKVSCEVINCFFNKDGYCYRDSIFVGAEKFAYKYEDTRCESFWYKNKKSNTPKSRMLDVAVVWDVDCEAINCIYNSNHRCCAEYINIKGNKAITYNETLCATFKEK